MTFDEFKRHNDASNDFIDISGEEFRIYYFQMGPEIHIQGPIAFYDNSFDSILIIIDSTGRLYRISKDYVVLVIKTFNGNYFEDYGLPTIESDKKAEKLHESLKDFC